ncbi:hypothetical protein D3C83_293060 [compost metagenome]
MDLRVVEDPLYLQIDSSATSASNVGAVRILYEEVTIREIDRLSLLAETLSA